MEQNKVEKLETNLIEKFKEINNFNKLLECLMLHLDFDTKDINRVEGYEDIAQEFRENPSQMNLISLANKLYYPIEDYGKSLRAYAEVLKTNKDFPQAYHHIGKIFMRNELFLQAYLLFNQGLSLKVLDSDNEYLNPNFHRKFHFDLSDLIRKIHEEDKSIKDFGFPIKDFNFVINEERRVYIPDFDYGYSNLHALSFESERAKEVALKWIHRILGKEQKIEDDIHNADNCPYLKYIVPCLSSNK